jgi:hypothetical protein
MCWYGLLILRFRDLSGICLQVPGKWVKKVGVKSDLFGVSGIENFPLVLLGVEMDCALRCLGGWW